MPEIYLVLDGQQSGPYSPAQVQQFLAEGRITRETPAWHAAMTDWGTIGQVLVPIPAPGLPPVPPGPSAPAPRKGMSGCLIAAIVTAAVLVLLLPCCAGIALGPVMNGIKKAQESAALQRSRQIGLMLFSYANDHNGAYPEGATSTEVFQKLLDEKYITDPAAFYIRMPGKVRPASGKLTADNVCFDVTAGAAPNSSDGLPMVFTTGYTLTYAPGASATPTPGTVSPFPGLIVCYKGNSAQFHPAAVDGSVPLVVPITFDPGGGTYRQLKP